MDDPLVSFMDDGDRGDRGVYPRAVPKGAAESVHGRKSLISYTCIGPRE